jgi:hypothetical protein
VIARAVVSDEWSVFGLLCRDEKQVHVPVHSPRRAPTGVLFVLVASNSHHQYYHRRFGGFIG